MYSHPQMYSHILYEKYFCILYTYFTVHYAFEEHEHQDCLGYDIVAHSSDGTPNHENCIKWCNDNGGCGGFAVYKKRCC